MSGNKTNPLIKNITSITGVLCYIGMGSLLMLMLLGAGDVIGRYFFNMPIEGAREISGILLAAIVFFGWAYTLSVGGHVRIDTFYILFPPRARATIDFITSLIGLIIFAFMTWQAAERALVSWKGHVLITVLFIPVFPFQFFVSVGAFALCLELTIQMAHSFSEMKRGS